MFKRIRIKLITLLGGVDKGYADELLIMNNILVNDISHKLNKLQEAFDKITKSEQKNKASEAL